MNKIKYLLITTAVVGFFAMTGCGGDDPEVNAVESVTERLTKTWVVDLNNSTSQVLFESENRTDTYDGFKLTLAKNSYTTVEVDVLDPWPASGQWQFTDTDNITDPNQNSFSITRGDNLVMNVTLSQDDNVMTLNFTYDQATHEGERVAAVDGAWTFVLVAE